MPGGRTQEQAKRDIDRLVTRWLAAPDAARRQDLRGRWVDPLLRALNWDLDADARALPPGGGLLLRPGGARGLLVVAAGPDAPEARAGYRRAYSTTAEHELPARRVAVAAVCDFATLRLLDCRDPAPLLSGDPDALARRTLPGCAWTCATYLDDFAALWRTLERGHVLGGSLEALLQGRPGGTPPDRVFLQDLERLRLELAAGLAEAAPDLDDAGLARATWAALERAVLAQALRDRGLAPEDPEGPLAGAAYSLAAMPVEVLGFAYEQFLAREIHRSGGGVEVRERPELRRSGGVYYTPRAIVDNIVARTVGRALQEHEAPTVLDPSCGAGVFLIAAYEQILERDRQTSGRPTLARRLELLQRCVFGVDIDPQAVAVTRLGLTLKLLEDAAPAELAALAELDLSGNVRVGNALIGPDLPAGVSAEERGAARPFAWSESFPQVLPRGFDVVLGNPPYDVLEKQRGAASWPHALLRAYVDEVAAGLRPALGRKVNLFRFFLVRALELLRHEGHLGCIVPMSLLADLSTGPTRRHLIERTRALELDGFPQKDSAARRVFRDAKLSTVVVIGRRDADASADRTLTLRTYPWDSFDDAPLRTCRVEYADVRALDPEVAPLPLADEEVWALCVRLHRHPRVVRLGSRPEFDIRRGEVNQTIYRRFITADPTHARLLRGSEVAPYRLQPPRQGSRAWLAAEACLASFTRDTTRAAWRALSAAPRIAVQRISGVDDARRLTAALVEPGVHLADSTNSIAGREGDLEYLLALLNSTLWQWRFRVTSTNNNVQTHELAGMPFRTLGRDERALAAEISAQVRALIAAGREQATPAELAARRDELDALVASLYDLDAADLELLARTARVSGAQRTR